MYICMDIDMDLDMDMDICLDIRMSLWHFCFQETVGEPGGRLPSKPEVLVINAALLNWTWNWSDAKQIEVGTIPLK